MKKGYLSLYVHYEYKKLFNHIIHFTLIVRNNNLFIIFIQTNGLKIAFSALPTVGSLSYRYPSSYRPCRNQISLDILGPY